MPKQSIAENALDDPLSYHSHAALMNEATAMQSQISELKRTLHDTRRSLDYVLEKNSQSVEIGLKYAEKYLAHTKKITCNYSQIEVDIEILKKLKI